MTALAQPSTQIERLRAFARSFVDALPAPNPLQDHAAARAFWMLLLSIVVDETCVAEDLTEDVVLSIYATAVAVEFLELEEEAAS